jgi:hypothetical protein
MYRILCAVAGAIMFTMPASAQSLKDQLVGTWRLVSSTNPNFSRD